MAKGDKKKNIFISHHGKDNDSISRFQRLLQALGYQIRNSSVSSKDNKARNESYIKTRILKPKITWAGKMIVLIGKETHKREYVNWEIEQAHKQGMPIIGVYLPGGIKGDYVVPENLKKYETARCGWSGDVISQALDGKFNDFQNPDGAPLTPTWSTGGRPTC